MKKSLKFVLAKMKKALEGDIKIARAARAANRISSRKVERDADSVSSGGTGDKKTFVSLLQIVIETGRFHQIRSQLAFAGHPILGDLKYGTEETIEFSHSHGIKHVALCAAKLVVPFQSGEKAYTVEPQNTAFRIC